MPIVNSKLGNGFLIKPVDSSLDQEHYFTSARKHIRLKIKGMVRDIDSDTIMYCACENSGSGSDHADYDGDFRNNLVNWSDWAMDYTDGNKQYTYSLSATSSLNAGPFSLSASDLVAGTSDCFFITGSKSAATKAGISFGGVVAGNWGWNYFPYDGDALYSGTIEFYYKPYDYEPFDSTGNNVLLLYMFNSSYKLLISGDYSAGLRQEYRLYAKLSGYDDVILIHNLGAPYGLDWVHLAVTFDRGAPAGQGLNFYVNGEAAGTGSDYGGWGGWVSQMWLPPTGSVSYASGTWNVRTAMGYYGDIRLSKKVRDIPNTWDSYYTESRRWRDKVVFTGSNTPGPFACSVYSHVYDSNNAKIDDSLLTSLLLDFENSPGLGSKMINPNFSYNTLSSSFGTPNVYFNDFDENEIWGQLESAIIHYGIYGVDLSNKAHSFKIRNDNSAEFSSFLSVNGVVPRVLFGSEYNNIVFDSGGNHMGDSPQEYSNIEFEFDYPLSNEGVEYYKNIENQHNKNIFYSVVPKILNSDSNFLEFPHSMGVFQMPNLILGTTDSGKIGNTEDDIIHIQYYGSFVKVLWPRQGDFEGNYVRGFGDFVAGQKPGKLSTGFVHGDDLDVTEYDHATLYCYLVKNVPGTLDSIEIKVERSPLKDVGYTTEQTVEYETSGSSSAIDVTAAKLKDLIYKKQIDYGDLSIREIGYPIDIPLTNAKKLRISARQSEGQNDESNKNFIVWGRFIKSEEET